MISPNLLAEHMLNDDRRRCGGRFRRAAGLAAVAASIGAAAPAIATATDTSTTTVYVTMECDSTTHCAGTLPDGALLDCVATDGRWTCRSGDGQIAEVDSTQLNRQLAGSGSGDPTEGKPLLPKVKVKVAIRVRPTGG